MRPPGAQLFYAFANVLQAPFDLPALAPSK